MRVVAYVELVILLRVVLGALTFQNSLLAPIIFAHFLRQRYYHSAFTRNAVAVVKARLDGYIDNEGVPPVARQVWTQAKNLIGKWGGSILVPADAQAAPRRQ
jgi:transmembrane protein 33